MRCHTETGLDWWAGREPPSLPGGEWTDRFDAPIPLRVLFRAPGECIHILGETPTPDGAGIPVPPAPWWGVEPLDRDTDDADFAALAALLREREVPGLHVEELPHITRGGFERLAGIESLRWLAFDDVFAPEGMEGLPLLRALPGLEDLDLGSFEPRAGELAALPRLASLRAASCGLLPEALADLGACPELRFLDLSSAPLPDAHLARLPALPRLGELLLGRFHRTAGALRLLERQAALRCVGLGDLPLDAEAIAALARLPLLEHLHDFRWPERPAELEELHRLGGLRILDGYPHPGSKELPHLARLPRLELLNLDGSDAGDEELLHLEGLRELRALSLRNTGVTDDGLPALAGLRRIETLDLSLTRITDAGLACLEGRGNLRRLGLDLCTGVTGRGLARLPADNALADLSAAGSGIDEAGLAAVAALPSLRWTNLRRTRITPEILDAFLRRRGGDLLHGDDVAR